MDDNDELVVYDWGNAGTPVVANRISLYDSAFETTSQSQSQSQRSTAGHGRQYDYPDYGGWDDWGDTNSMTRRSGQLSSANNWHSTAHESNDDWYSARDYSSKNQNSGPQNSSSNDWGSTWDSASNHRNSRPWDSRTNDSFSTWDSSFNNRNSRPHDSTYTDWFSTQNSSSENWNSRPRDSPPKKRNLTPWELDPYAKEWFSPALSAHTQPASSNGIESFRTTDTKPDQDDDWPLSFEEIDYSDQLQNQASENATLTSQTLADSVDTEKVVENTDITKTLELFEVPQPNTPLTDQIPICASSSKPSTERSLKKANSGKSLKRKHASTLDNDLELEGLLGKVNCRFSSRTYAKPTRKKDSADPLPGSSTAETLGVNEAEPSVSFQTDMTTQETTQDQLLISLGLNETDDSDDEDEDKPHFVKIRTDIFDESQED